VDVKRAQDIYASKETVSVHVDEENGMATVQVGSRPTNTHTVGVERLEEQEH